jgi:glycosyltransferase involved in cell wall biosynthesis
MKALLIGFVWPEPQSSAAGLRSLSLIRAFHEAGWEVHFATSNRKERADEGLKALGVRTWEISPNDPAFDAWIAELKPDFVVFERFMIEEQFGWRVRKHSPDSVRVLDTVDLHFLRRARQQALKENPRVEVTSLPDSVCVTDDALREVASIYRSDLSLLISEHELQLLSDPNGAFRVPSSLLREFSFCYDSPAPLPLSSEPGEHFVVIGNFRHEPNADGVRWLRKDIWPEIRARLPEAQVHVYGAYPSREMMELSDERNGFLVRGPAVDQYETLRRYRINLAPLRFGAGLKGKISDGWWCGKPCVTTSVGAEGMKSGALFGGRIADGPEAFAQAAFELYVNEPERTTAARVGRETVALRFDHARNARRLVHDLEAVRAGIQEQRASNFVGKMLTHHLHQSTKYFSRWIELKESKGNGA